MLEAAAVKCPELRAQQQRRQLADVEDERREMLRRGEIEDEGRDAGLVYGALGVIRLLLGI
jgi:hypothetical protein